MNLPLECAMFTTNVKHEIRVSLNRVCRSSTPKIKTDKLIYIDEDGVCSWDGKEESEIRSRRRARVAVVDLAMCNDFDFFGTITIDSAKKSIENPVATCESLLQAFDNYKQYHRDDFAYVLVPEFGEELGRLHFHFLAKGITTNINEYGKLDWKYIRDKFGFVNITKIKATNLDRVRVARYCSKYVTKSSVKIAKCRYFASHGLNRPVKTAFYEHYLANCMREFLQMNAIEPYCASFFGVSYVLPIQVYKDFEKWYILEKAINTVLNVSMGVQLCLT